MEISYLWIENYKSIEKQGFHFDSSISIEIKSYTKTVECNLEFTIHKNKSEQPFWIFDKKITNISAIVGENGAGKTSLMEFLYNEVGFQNSTFQYLLILKIDIKKYLIYRNVCGYKCENPVIHPPRAQSNFVEVKIIFFQLSKTIKLC